MLLLLSACAGKGAEPVETAETDSDTDSDSDTDTDADSDTDADTDADTDTTTTDPAACATTCDCVGADELCYDGTCRVAGPALDAYRATLDRMLAAMDPVTGEFADEGAYPTEAMMTFASGAALLCDDDLAQAAETRATFARSWETSDHFLVYPGFGSITRDYQARHVYNLWAAGHALDDPALLAAADDAATAMLGLERVDYKGEWTLFCVTYSTAAGHACDNGYTWIDDNQDSEIGLAFALLASDPDSALYGDADALDVVANELAAATSIQDPTTGAIPIGSEGERASQYDTLYGSYAAWSWALAEPVVTDPAMAGPVALASTWLAPYSDATPESHRFYPSTYDGDISLSEGAMRIPLLSRTGALDPAFLDYYWTVTVPADSETYSVWMPFWLATDAGVPLADLIPPAE